MYDVVFEAVNKSSFSACMRVLKDDGVYVNVTEPLPSIQMLWTKMTSGKKLMLGENAPERAEDLIFSERIS